MHLKLVIVCGLLFSVINSAPRKNDGDSNFVMIGNSKDGYKLKDDDDKSHRSGYPQSYPIVLHNRPTSPYQASAFGSYGPTYNPHSSLISANIHLLEPFMLVTFLLFVLTLVDRARVQSLISRRDVVQETPINDTNSGTFDVDHYHYPYHFFKTIGKRNETEF